MNANDTRDSTPPTAPAETGLELPDKPGVWRQGDHWWAVRSFEFPGL